jgi:starch-binding outer membrane protein, SusD/RagB family
MTKMIKYKFILMILTAGIMFTACEDSLVRFPEQSLDESVAFSSRATAEASLNGVYSQAQLIEVFGSQPQIVQDYMADNTFFVGSFPTLQDINNYVTTSPNVSIQSWWQVHYRAINGANLVIDNVPNISDPAMTEAISNRIIGEAKFLRAILYFSLVNQFAQPYNLDNGASLGVPLVLTGFTGEIEYPSRATVAEVHAQIRQDLVEAMDAVTGTNRGRASQAACAAYLSRLHLYRGEYQQAADFAKMVLDNSNYSVASDFSFYSPNLNSEHVFAIVNSAIDNGRTGAGGWASYHRPPQQGGRGDCAFDPSLEAAFESEADDLRYTQLSDVVTAADAMQRRMTRKFLDAATNTDPVHMMRTSEVALNRAEALAELNGVNQESVDLINPIRTRAGLAEWEVGQFSSKDAFVDAILTERRKELCFEGHRRMDLLRKGLPLRAGNPAAAFGADRTILPIPQREVDLNPNLVQNPGYN